MFFHVLDSVISDRVSVIKILWRHIDWGVVFSECYRGKIITRTFNSSEEAIEATLSRPVVLRSLFRVPSFAVRSLCEFSSRPVAGLRGYMPLARHIGGVAGVLQDLSYSDGLVINIALVCRHSCIVRHITEAGLMGIESSQ